MNQKAFLLFLFLGNAAMAANPELANAHFEMAQLEEQIKEAKLTKNAFEEKLLENLRPDSPFSARQAVANRQQAQRDILTLAGFPKTQMSQYIVDLDNQELAFIKSLETFEQDVEVEPGATAHIKRFKNSANNEKLLGDFLEEKKQVEEVFSRLKDLNFSSDDTRQSAEKAELNTFLKKARSVISPVIWDKYIAPKLSSLNFVEMTLKYRAQAQTKVKAGPKADAHLLDGEMKWVEERQKVAPRLNQ